MSGVPLEAQRLECVRDNVVLFSDLSFQVETGSITQIMGANGSGKTSLLRILTGIMPAESGRVLWFGQTIGKQRVEYGAALTFIGHLPGIKSQLTPLENLAWLAPEASVEACNLALRELGLSGFEDSPCYRLSAGQKRRVALARLYVQQRPLWILDEPFTSLDKNGVSKIEALLCAHTQAGGMVILTTHHEFALDSACVREVMLGTALC